MTFVVRANRVRQKHANQRISIFRTTFDKIRDKIEKTGGPLEFTEDEYTFF